MYPPALDISHLGRVEDDSQLQFTKTQEEEASEEDEMDNEQKLHNDEFWTKQAEKINQRMNGIMKNIA